MYGWFVVVSILLDANDAFFLPQRVSTFASSARMDWVSYGETVSDKLFFINDDIVVRTKLLHA